MPNINDLNECLKKHNQTLVGVMFQDNQWCVYAHDPSIAGHKPKLSECRDAQDFLLLKSQWETKGRIILFVDEDFDMAIRGAIEAANSH